MDQDYWDDEMAEEFMVRRRAERMGIKDSPELRRFIAQRDAFSITDHDLEQFLDDEEE